MAEAVAISHDVATGSAFNNKKNMIQWGKGENHPKWKERKIESDNLPAVKYLGQVQRDEIMRLLGGAKFLVFPSVWYEGFPVTIVESLSSGTPVITTDLGSMREIIHDKEHGLLFEPGNSNDLKEKVLSVSELGYWMNFFLLTFVVYFVFGYWELFVVSNQLRYEVINDNSFAISK
ncbi:glycosyltransferase family 4 protein [archaeon]|nr:glycosyltransferase family 4 protein [archaeon]